MKQAYVSLVVQLHHKPTPELIASVDEALHQTARMHEIVIVAPSSISKPSLDRLALFGPVTWVTVPRTRTDMTIFGLSRAAGDFIIDWRDSLGSISPEKLTTLLDNTDGHADLVEWPSATATAAYRFEFWLINRFRRNQFPLTISKVRVFSRRAVNSLLNASLTETDLDLLVADYSGERTILQRAERGNWAQSRQEAALYRRMDLGQVFHRLSRSTGLGVSMVLIGIIGNVLIMSLGFLTLTQTITNQKIAIFLVVSGAWFALCSVVLLLLSILLTHRVQAIEAAVRRHSEDSLDTQTWSPIVPRQSSRSEFRQPQGDSVDF